jgi:serine/threonine-protein kinase
MEVGGDHSVTERDDDDPGEDAQAEARVDGVGDAPQRDTIVMPDEHDERAPMSRQDELAEAEKLVGKVIADRYRIVEMIAAGGMGAVFRGEHVHMRHRVAVKVLLPQTVGLPELVQRFEREAIAGAHIRHPNVAAATDFGRDDDGNHFLVLEYARGETLADVIRRGPVAPEEVCRIGRELAAALQAVHDKGIVHRDVKPKNVILSEDDGSVKLLDFGFAKVDVDQLSTETESQKPMPALTAVGMVLGTIPYMAPEVARGMSALDARADLYALGIILYELLSGKHPFETATERDMFAAHCFQQPPAIATRSPGVTVPPSLEAVVMTLLAKKPDERFASAAATITALDSVGDDDPEVVSAAPAREDAATEDASEDAAGEDATREDAARDVDGGKVGAALAKAGAALARARHHAAKLGARLLTAAKRSPRAAGVIAAGVCVIASLALVWCASEPDPIQSDGPSAPASETPVARGYAEAPPASPTITTVAGLDAGAWREKLVRAAQIKSWLTGAEALQALATLDPSAFDDADARSAAVSVAVGIATGTDAQAAPVFRTLSHELGERGLELLWEIVRSKGGTAARSRAVSLLRAPDIAARASPALLVAFEMRTRGCADKAELFPRAAEVGDRRVLQELQILRHAKCRREHDVCCFRSHTALAEAMAALEAKLGK